MGIGMKLGMQFTERAGESTGAHRPAASGGSFNDFDDDMPFGSFGTDDDVIWRGLGRRIKKEKTN